MNRALALYASLGKYALIFAGGYFLGCIATGLQVGLGWVP